MWGTSTEMISLNKQGSSDSRDGGGNHNSQVTQRTNIFGSSGIEAAAKQR